MQRRTFLSLCCVSAASLLPGHALAEAGESKSRYAMLIDLRRCVGCQSCTVSCGAENAVPLGNFRTTVSEYAMGGVHSEHKVPRACPCVLWGPRSSGQTASS